MMEPGYWWSHGFGFMWIVPLIFLVVFLLFLRGIFGNRPADTEEKHRETAREILDKRFARGEITREEYEEMKKALGDDQK